nr:hypothetical protein CFP56_63570 [Quercus suber]
MWPDTGASLYKTGGWEKPFSPVQLPKQNRHCERDPGGSHVAQFCMLRGYIGGSREESAALHGNRSSMER